ncbi:hypothetical protein ACTG1M_14235 [Aeromonas sp. 107A]
MTEHIDLLPISTDDEQDAGNRYLYYTEGDLARILANLEQLRHAVFPAAIGESETGAAVPHNFPSVCLVGLGRCGSNIAQDVASLVYNARSFYLNEFNSEEQRKREKEFGPVSWIRRNLRLPNNGARPVFLIEPMVMLGDLDKDIDGRIRHSNRSGEGGSLRDYAKMRVMDLSEIHAGGAGNAPILGQYLAKIILNKSPHYFANSEWQAIHTYLVDSCGIKANQSRLYFYIFSAGGGTGSGMASEFGLAQQTPT